MSEASAQACAELVKTFDRDRWLATLLLPEAAQAGVMALYAFSAEIARVRDSVSQPTLGEIRLQWWREVLDGARAGEAAAHPVASELLAAVARFDLPRHPLRALVEARVFDLYDDPVPSLNFLEGYCGETVSSLFRLAAIVVAGGRDPGGAAAAGQAGVAYGVTGLMRALPWHAAQGRCHVPRDLLERHGATRDDVVAGRATPGVLAALAELRALARRRFEEAKAGLDGLDPPARRAFAPLALVPLFLDQLQRAAAAPFAPGREAPQWRRQWAMWRW